MVAFGSSEAFAQGTLPPSGLSVRLTAVGLQEPRPEQSEVRPRACEPRAGLRAAPRTGGAKPTRSRRGRCRCARAQPVCRAPRTVSGEALPCSAPSSRPQRPRGRAAAAPAQQRPARGTPGQRVRPSATQPVPPPLGLPSGAPRPAAQARPIPPRPSRPGGAAGMAADGRRDDEELPVYLARPGSAAAPRPKRGGLFCNVEGAFESKTLDFGALRVGQRRAPPPTGPDPPPGAAPGPGQTAGGLRATSGEERLQDPAPADDRVGPAARRGRAGAGAGTAGAGPGAGSRRAVWGRGWVRPPLGPGAGPGGAAGGAAVAPPPRLPAAPPPPPRRGTVPGARSSARRAGCRRSQRRRLGLLQELFYTFMRE